MFLNILSTINSMYVDLNYSLKNRNAALRK